jgi:C4-dicarboxylate transporter DctM subunit
MEVIALFCSILLLLVIGIPVSIALGLSSLLFVVFFSDGTLASIAQTLFSAFHGHYTLLAIPFFILASTFMATGGVAQRIIRFAIALVGHLRGGLAMSSVLACMFFAALCGSSPATVVAVGSILIAGMCQAGYSKEFAAGLICNAGTLGILIPPSIVMVVYAAATDVSVGRMFLGGLLPGILAGLMLMASIYAVARWKKLPTQPWSGWREVYWSGRDAAWGLLLIVIIMGGIYGGVFTPTEAAAVAAVYAFIVTNFVYLDVGPFSNGGRVPGPFIYRCISVVWHPDTKLALLEASKLSIVLMFIIANALVLKHVLTDEGVPQSIAGAMLEVGFGPILFLLFLNVLLLAGGQFMEPSGLIIIVAPFVFPVAMELGIDPIHLGIIMVVNMEIGMITPPVGLNLFVTSGVADMPVTDVVKAAAPFLVVLFAVLVLVTYVPMISTFLPTLVLGPELVGG